MTTISIKGMSCQHCVTSVTKALEEIPGVTDVNVDLEKGEASYDGDIDDHLVNGSITKIGFEVI